MRPAILVILTDHERRVRLRKLAEDKMGVPVVSAANPSDGLDLLSSIKPPGLILLSTQTMPLMSYEEFLLVKASRPELAAIPVTLLSTQRTAKLPEGVQEELTAPLAESELERLVRQYCLGENPKPKR